MQLERPVALGLIDDPTLEEIEIHDEGVVVADLLARPLRVFERTANILSARRNEGEGYQLVEAAVMRRALSTRSGAGQTHVGTVSPRITDQQHGKATGGEAPTDGAAPRRHEIAIPFN
jgi:hypothetical protein